MRTEILSERRLPSLNAVRSFEAAARHLSFTLAARELCVTQGAVSRMVQALESELGVTLFRRIGRQLELTAAGAAYHPHILEALDRIAAAGMGVALLPLFLVKNELASGRLVQPFSATIRNERAYYIVHACGVGQMRKIRFLKEWLLAQAASG